MVSLVLQDQRDLLVSLGLLPLLLQAQERLLQAQERLLQAQERLLLALVLATARVAVQATAMVEAEVQVKEWAQVHQAPLVREEVVERTCITLRLRHK